MIHPDLPQGAFEMPTSPLRTVALAMAGRGDTKPPADPAPEASTLAARFSAKAQVYQPWFGGCSGDKGPVHEDIYIRQPEAEGPSPVSGFVAASVEYDSLASVPDRGPCDSANAKAQRTLAVDDSGWGQVPDSECGGSCKHEHLDRASFYEPDTWWGVDKNLDWLSGLAP